MTSDLKLKNIVILGAGFGGITALLKLRRFLKRRGLLARYQLILVNKSGQHLYTPALYEIASLPRGEAGGLCLKSAICIQVEDITSRFPEIRFVGGEVYALDPQARKITLTSGEELAFDYALIALGAQTNYFGIPGLKENSYPLKTFEDAVRLRNRAAELVAGSRDPIRIVVGGGGATGVELAAELVNYLCRLRKRPSTGKYRDEILIAEAGPDILSGFSHKIVRRARRRLKRLGVKIMTGAAIREVKPEAVILQDGRILPGELLIWSGGVKAASAIERFGLLCDKKGAIAVNEFLEAEPRIYAVGDCASFINPKTGKPLPWNVPVAESQARTAALNITADIAGGPKRAFRPLAGYPFILAVGGKYALTDLVIIRFFGFLGWLAKQLVELRYLLFILPRGKAIKMWLRTVYYSTRND